MNSYPKTHQNFLLACLSLISLVGLICTASSAENGISLGQTEAILPGVTYKITNIRRTNTGSLLVSVCISVGANAPNPIFIGRPPVAGWKDRKSLTEEQLTSGKFDPTPLSLKDAVLFAQVTKMEYKALPDLPAAPFVGPNALMTSMRPGDWMQMAVQFPCPTPPPADSDGNVPEQKISILLPGAKTPIRNIPLPPI